MILLSAITSVETVAEKFAISGMMIARGMGTVFMVLMILWGILSIFGVVFGEKKKKPQPVVKQTEVKPATETETPTEASIETANDDNGALIAVITAAIEAYRAEEAAQAGEAYTLPFRVVSFKRKSGKNGWNSNNAENN